VVEGEMFRRVWEKTILPPNTDTGFDATGILLCGTDILPNESYTTNAVPDVAVPEEDEMCRSKKIQRSSRLLMH
jgi:hypothetical protein